MFDRVLIPLDGSPTAESILPRVRKLLQREGTEALLVRAVPVPVVPEGDPSGLLSELQKDADEQLARVRADLAKDGIRVRSLSRVGSPGVVIADSARQEKATLVAMTTHGRTGFARFILGSVAEKVLRSGLEMPILLVRSFRPGPDGRPVPTSIEPLEPSKILLPFDGSPESLSVIPAVIEMAVRFGAGVRLLHVLEQPGPYAKTEDAMAMLQRAAKEFEAAGVRAVFLVRVGEAAQGIVEAADEGDADLVAMSTHGRSGIGRWVLGSVAEKVLRATHKPLLLVRARREK